LPNSSASAAAVVEAGDKGALSRRVREDALLGERSRRGLGEEELERSATLRDDNEDGVLSIAKWTKRTTHEALSGF
jgi:hypothetical protein